MNYTLNQLQIFLKIVQTQSVTKASEELHLTQPAVSIQLKNFQDQFDIPLTEVVGKKIYITDFGKEIAVAAEKIVHQLFEIQFQFFLFLQVEQFLVNRAVEVKAVHDFPAVRLIFFVFFHLIQFFFQFLSQILQFRLKLII